MLIKRFLKNYFRKWPAAKKTYPDGGSKPGSDSRRTGIADKSLRFDTHIPPKNDAAGALDSVCKNGSTLA